MIDLNSFNPNLLVNSTDVQKVVRNDPNDEILSESIEGLQNQENDEKFDQEQGLISKSF